MKPTEFATMQATEQAADQQAKKLRQRLGLVLVLERGLRFLTIAGFIVGSLILACRVGLALSFDQWPGVFILIPVLGLVAAVVPALVSGLRALPTEPTIRALIDRQQRQGGLLMANHETHLGTWRQSITRAAPAQIHWRSGPAWLLLAGAGLFMVVSFLVPARRVEADGPRPLNISAEIAEIEERLEVLEEENLLKEDEAERLDLALEELVGAASGEDPARAWEALDHLTELTENTAREAAEAAFTDGERLAAAEEVVKALEQQSGPPELEEDALSDLAALTAKAAEENRLLDQGLTEALANAARSGNPAELKKALGQGRAGLEGKLERLHKAGLINLETAMKAKSALKSNDQTLAAFLAENGLEAAAAYCELPGQGGVNRGRGDAPMNWADRSSREGTEFKEQVLDAASLATLEKSGLIGLQATAPHTGGRQPSASSGGSGLDPTSSSGGAAYTQQVLPRHRGAVRRFFERGDG